MQRTQLLKRHLTKRPRNSNPGVWIIDPMAYRKNILLGRIIKASGYKGAVSVKLEKIFTENIPDMESVFLEVEGRPVPFFISDSEYNGGDIIKLTFEGYGSPDKISEFTGCDVFLTTDIKGELTNEESGSLDGYKVMLPAGDLLGTVIGVIFNSGQWLLNIESQENKEVLVPFHEDFVLSIDHNKKHIIMEIPEGLSEIN